MKIMPEKIYSALSYCISLFMICMGGLVEWFQRVDWNKVAVISGVIIGIATFLSNVYYKRRQTKAMEKAAEIGVVITPGRD